MSRVKLTSNPTPLPESFAAAVVDAAMDAVIALDEDQRIILFNPAAEQMFRCKLKDALGQKLELFIPELHHPTRQQHIAQFKNAGKTTRAAGSLTTLCGRRANGEEFPLETTFSEINIAGKKMLTAILRDVTEKFHANEARARLAAIVASSDDAIIGKNLEGIVTSWNHGAEKIFGYSQKEMVGQPVEELIPPDRLAEEEQMMNRIRRGERVKRFETVRRHKDGRLLHVSITVSPIKDDSGRILGVSKVTRDITERKRAELELRQREEYFRSLIEYASDLITLVDEEGIIHFQSPSIARVLDLAAEKVLGRNLAEFIYPEDWPRVSGMIRRALANPESPVSIEYRIRHQNGAWHLFASLGRSIPHGADGKRVAFNSRDITASRNLEDQLLQAQKMEAIGTLAGGIAHDFNNMLAGILGSAELVREDLGPRHPSQEYVQSIFTAANRARELVQQILTFSRRRDNEKRVSPLQPIVGECLKLLRSTIPAMVKITHHIESQCPPVLADPTQIHQVVMNICTNAWHALPESGGHIDISLRPVKVDAALVARHRELRPGLWARLAISDNGHGMDETTRSRIFEPFFTTKPAGKGSGLGLSVVHGIIKSHRGALLVESDLGKGTTFQIYLPCSQTNEGLPSLSTPNIPRGHGERILFVDDEIIVGKSAEEYLRRLGYVVTLCEQSENALSRFRQAPQDFDLIMTDWAMPGMSGMELVTAIREVRRDIPMLLMSGSVGPLMEKMAKDMGMGNVLVKPVNPEIMAQAVAQAVLSARAGNTLSNGKNI